MPTFRVERVPSFVYCKYLGSVLSPDGWSLRSVERGVALYYVRSVGNEIIGGSHIIGQLTNRRFKSFQGEFGWRPQAFDIRLLRKLDRIQYEPKELAKFKPELQRGGGQLLYFIANDEESVLSIAYEQRLYVRPTGQEYDKSWEGLQKYQEQMRQQRAHV